eukprot:2530416-Alexandrium_andersonii.AAC.1
MSASLVGSEMCIRDSPSRADPGGRWDVPLYYVADRAGGRKLSSEGKRAVSYTHLTLPTICSV